MIGRTVGHLRRHGVAWLALFVALGGTATATHLVVRASDIQKNAVRTKHLKPGAVKLRQVKTPSVARRFGSGVVGAHGTLGPVGAGAAGLASVAPVGTGGPFAMPMPKKVKVRDLVARANTDLARPVEVRVRRGTDVVLSCTIPAEARTCSTGKAKAAFPKGALLSVRLFTPAAPIAVGSTSFELGYRITP